MKVHSQALGLQSLTEKKEKKNFERNVLEVLHSHEKEQQRQFILPRFSEWLRCHFESWNKIITRLQLCSTCSLKKRQ